jgi:hypothetical protein
MKSAMLGRPKAWLPYSLFGIHACTCFGSSEVCGTKAITQRSRVDSRETGSALFASAISGENASHSTVNPPAEPPQPPMRSLSMRHSSALLRTNCNARAASSRQAFTGGSIFAACASAMSR